MNRIWKVVRLQLINRETFLWVPPIVLIGTLIITLLVFALIPYDGPKYGGGSQAPLWYYAAVGIFALTRTFPFSQAMSVTRSAFWAGTVLTAVMSAVLLAAIFVAGGFLELATGGWGMNGYFFHLDWMWSDGWFGAALMTFAATMLAFLIGLVAAIVFKRFGNVVLTVILVGLGLLLVAAIWLIGRLEAWPDVIGWFVTTGATGFALVLLAAAAVLAAGSYGLLRRTVP